MNEAVKFAIEIIRKREALYNTKSEKLRRDYEKSIQTDMKDLLFYVRCHRLNMTDVWKMAFKVMKGAQNDEVRKSEN